MSITGLEGGVTQEEAGVTQGGPEEAEVTQVTQEEEEADGGQEEAGVSQAE
jgi:hypothetical protein